MIKYWTSVQYPSNDEKCGRPTNGIASHFMSKFKKKTYTEKWLKFKCIWKWWKIIERNQICLKSAQGKWSENFWNVDFIGQKINVHRRVSFMRDWSTKFFWNFQDKQSWEEQSLKMASSFTFETMGRSIKLERISRLLVVEKKKHCAKMEKRMLFFWSKSGNEEKKRESKKTIFSINWKKRGM